MRAMPGTDDPEGQASAESAARKGADTVDRAVHEPTRLSILSHLASSESGGASFIELKEALSLTSGNLSVQLRNLEEVGYLRIEKSFRGLKPLTEVYLTARGESALIAYVERMESIIASLKAKAAKGGA